VLLLLLFISGTHAYYFGQNKVNAISVDWSMIETLHFDIYFPAGNDEFGQTCALMSEEIYYYLKSDLLFPMGNRIPIIFYGSKNEFQTTNIVYPILSEGVGGFTESIKNRVVVPFEGSYTKLEQVLTHELVHAYVMGLDSSLPKSLLFLRQSNFPFWFSEGLPEFLSIGGADNYNNMFILDLILNDKFPKLDNVDGYYAYRLGEAFLSYIADVYGREKVIDLFYAIKALNDLDAAAKKIFGMEFKDLESRWRYYLKRKYFPVINTHDIPKESFEQRTNSSKDGSYINFMPRISPNGERYIYFSNRGARYSIWMGGIHGLSPSRKILLGEATAKHEEFYYFRANLAWFPDSKRIAFVSKTSDGDRIYIFDVDRRKVLSTIALPELSGIYEIDVSPNGTKLIISGQKKMQSDLFLYDLENSVLTQITNDRYNDTQPRFSPCGDKFAFASERTKKETDLRKGFFSNLSSNIFSYEFETGKFRQHTFEDYNCFHPLWDSTGTKLIFLSEERSIANYDVIDLETNTRGNLTNTLSGIFAGDISGDNQYLMFSTFFDNAWDIYFGNNPLDDIEYQNYIEPQEVILKDDLFDEVDIAKLDLFGKRPPRKFLRKNPDEYRYSNQPYMTGYSYKYSSEDSLQLVRDYSWDNRPDSIGINIPKVIPYKLRFGLDRFWGGIAYSSSQGTIGQIELGMSDLMGNHAIGVDLSITGVLKESDILFTYLFLKKRIDYGIGIYNLYDEYYYRYWISNNWEYRRERQREVGVYLLARYPFSRYLRIDFEQRLFDWRSYFDYGTWNDEELDFDWEKIASDQTTVYLPGLSIVHDNALYGETGPLVGWRGKYTVSKAFSEGDLSYLTNYMDLRVYTLFSKRYAWAWRIIGGISNGKSPQRFGLGGYYGVRALEEDRSGYKKAMTSIELRYPFLDYLAIAFPLPITLGSVRGSAFIDAGSVWDVNKKFRPIRDGMLEDLAIGYGFGPRMNLGYVVLKLDVAWSTDLSRISKPSYYLSLTEDF